MKKKLTLTRDLPKWLDRTVVANLLRAVACCPRDCLALTLCYRYGLRASELLRLNRDDVLFDARRLRVKSAKGSRDAEIALFRDVDQQIRRYLATRDDDGPELIHGRKGRMVVFSLERIFAQAAREAGLSLNPRQNVHCLRHSIAVHMLDAGRDVYEAKDWLRHRSITSTEIYAQVSSAKRLATAEAMDSSSFVVKA